MENILTQIRDNLRFANWTCFPANSIEYIYDQKTEQLITKVYKRKGEPVFSTKYIYEGDKLVHELRTDIDNGADNL